MENLEEIDKFLYTYGSGENQLLTSCPPISKGLRGMHMHTYTPAHK